MPSHEEPELFIMKTDGPVGDWGSFMKELSAYRPSLLKIWQQEYECWKHYYKRFRECEDSTLYSADAEGNPTVLEDSQLRLHRKALLELMGTGETCREHLIHLPLDNDDDHHNRLLYLKRLQTLTDSLQESLELWHPINKDKGEELRQKLAV